MQSLLSTLEKEIPKLAKAEILSRFKKVTYRFKADGSLVTEADEAMQQAITNLLQQLSPEVPVLGEEMTQVEQQSILDKKDENVWVLDPLDGTTNFSMGIPIFSVSIALLQDNHVKLGLIYDPIRDECFSAALGQGAFLNQQPLKIQQPTQQIKSSIAQVDLKRLPTELACKIAREHPFASQRNFGSGALDWCWLAANRSQLYVHGGQKLWDYVAGQLILSEAGGYASHFDGSAVFCRSLQARSVIAASGEVLFQKWRDYILADKNT